MRNSRTRILIFLLFLVFNHVQAQQADSIQTAGNIKIEGNHKTLRSVILREIPFNQGDTIVAYSPEQYCSIIENNLMNTELFNFVNVKTKATGERTVNFWVEVEERWYLWPSVYIDYADRNLNSWWKKQDLQRLNYKVGLLKNNFRGRREELGFEIQAGYEEQLAIQYEIPYLNSAQTLGLMFLGSYDAYHTIAYGSLDNELRYLHYKEDYARQDLKVSLSLKYRPDIYTWHQFTLGWRKHWISDTLLQVNERYSLQRQPAYWYLSYILKVDHRDYKAYPLKGYYADFAARKFGLSGASGETDYLLLKTNFRKYFELKPDQWFVSAGMVAQKSIGAAIPYYLTHERGMGYERDFVRGMEYYVVDQTDWVYMKTNIKKRILDTKIIHLGFLENKLFGEKFSKIPIQIFTNAFYDAGYAGGSLRAEQANPLLNQWQHGFGIGLDFVTYYDKVLRTEFSWNHLGDFGVYFHMIAPI